MHAFVYSFIDLFIYLLFIYVCIYLFGWFYFQLIIETLQSTEIYSHKYVETMYLSYTDWLL